MIAIAIDKGLTQYFVIMAVYRHSVFHCLRISSKYEAILPEDIKMLFKYLLYNFHKEDFRLRLNSSTINKLNLTASNKFSAICLMLSNEKF